MVPIITIIRAKTVEQFGELVRHPGEEYIHVLEGRIEVHTEFYDPVVLAKGESIYIDSNMGHAYLAAEGCDEAVTIGVCSSAEDDIMSSLMSLHGVEQPTAKTLIPAHEPGRARKRVSAASKSG